MHESPQLPVLFKEEIVSLDALLAIGAFSVEVKVGAETLPVGLYLFPSIGMLSLHGVILLISLLHLTLMGIVDILASVVVPCFRSSLMMRVLVIVISPPVVIRNFLHRMIVVAVIVSQKLACCTELADWFMLLDLLHVTLV